MSKPVPLAVALQYDKSAVPVPRVVAKGRGESGEAILALAREHGVPIEENAPLAEALAQVELGDDIPEALYRAVAEVLVFILRATGKISSEPVIAPPMRPRWVKPSPRRISGRSRARGRCRYARPRSARSRSDRTTAAGSRATASAPAPNSTCSAL